ncbi:DUF7522 family protein [Haloparvum sedimenti]|uniref:DUF7522 family protein n=1 Tax=Haloparvum sedimenti TaxID=1678448 RepID=UPI00071E6BB9|nr:hypothetical protein [Haloparvum sedimenti]
MEPGNTDELVAFLKEQAGEYLRSAIQYSTSDHELLYLRDGDEHIPEDEELADFVDHYRRLSRQQEPDRPFDLGTDHCTVTIYDEAILFHFTQSENVGTLVTLAPEAGRDIVAFTTKCLEQLHFNSPQEIRNVPTWLRS